MNENNGWTEFGPWSSCSETCGMGIKIRHRNCTNKENICPGKSGEFGYCIEDKCLNTISK